MSALTTSNHIHTYERLDSGNFKGEYYRCIHPDCTHYIRKDLILGKRALCKCGQEYILTRYHLKRLRPNCGKCNKPKTEEKFTEIIMRDRIAAIFNTLKGPEK